MNYSYKAIIQYWGTQYFGWQKQPDHPSIQGTLEKTLEIVTRSKSLRTKASGRTDAGVHALGQVVRIDIAHDIPDTNLMRACNNLLPNDIKIISMNSIENKELGFCPQRHATSKEYHYNFFLKQNISRENTPIIFKDLYIHTVNEFLDIELMKKACELFIGEHDFSHFYCEGTPVKSYVRKIFKCEIHEAEHCTLKISGNGFLKQMVRLIMGAIWSVGAKRLSLEQLQIAIEQPLMISKRHVAALAPAKGLLLHHVIYS